jgi:hypothetical protein
MDSTLLAALSETNKELAELKDEVREIRKIVSIAQIQSFDSTDQELLDVNGAAKFLKLRPQTIYDLVHKRKLGKIKREKKLYFKKEHLQKYLDDGYHMSIDEIVEENKKRRS